MVELLFSIVGIAVIGSLGVPAVILTLARFGYFEPIHISLFGRIWNFSPEIEVSQSLTDVSILIFPRQAVFASAVTAVFTVGASNYSTGLQQITGAGATGYVRDFCGDELSAHA